MAIRERANGVRGGLLGAPGERKAKNRPLSLERLHNNQTNHTANPFGCNA